MRFIFSLIICLFTSMSVISASEMSDFTDNHVEAGNSHAKNGNYAEALNKLNLAISQNNQEPRAYKLRAHVHYAMNNYREALSDLNQFVSLVPNSAIGYADRSIIHSSLKNHAAALADIECALKIKPTSVYLQAVREKINEFMY